ncbi:hypothetical protein HDU82_009139 [Entophlyctis luteolus]|nr:hypothetical protein HDU82_009139 [Entophlyctis luteolus]
MTLPRAQSCSSSPRSSLRPNSSLRQPQQDGPERQHNSVHFAAAVQQEAGAGPEDELLAPSGVRINAPLSRVRSSDISSAAARPSDALRRGATTTVASGICKDPSSLMLPPDTRLSASNRTSGMSLHSGMKSTEAKSSRPISVQFGNVSFAGDLREFDIGKAQVEYPCDADDGSDVVQTRNGFSRTESFADKFVSDASETPSRRVSRRAALGSEDAAAIPQAAEVAQVRLDVQKHLASLLSVHTTGRAREIVETWNIIVVKMQWSLISLVVNTLLLAFIFLVHQNIVVSVQQSVVTNYGGVMVEVVLLGSNIVTGFSLDEAASCVFGYLLASPRGFSAAVCGFMQASPVEKWLFSQNLALTSPSRKILARVSVLWILLESLKIVTPFSAIALQSAPWSSYSDVSDCVYFVQGTQRDGTPALVDRQWPNLDVAAGVAEYAYGTSLGIMRSETAGVNATTAMYPPQLISALSSGDTIMGLGFSADIRTQCKCATAVSTLAFEAAGVSPTHSQEVLDAFLGLNGTMGLTFGVVAAGESVVVSNVLGGYSLCGTMLTKRYLPAVCSTRMDNHQQMMLEISFMTDGTTASIAPNTVSALYAVGKANASFWLYSAVSALTRGPVSSYNTPATVPGGLSPLLWWTSPNLIAVDRGLLEAGLETMYAILFKAAIQRTYTPQATSCPRRSTMDTTQSVLVMQGAGYNLTVMFLVIQLAISILSASAFLLWFASPHPIGPAVRATRESVYLLALLYSSRVGNGLPDMCNAETFTIWQKLDVEVRIGESVETVEEETGRICMEKVSMVRGLTNGRQYC